MDFLKSVSKIVFLLMAFSACAGFFLGRLEAKDFMVLAMSAFAFYFGLPNRGQPKPNEDGFTAVRSVLGLVVISAAMLTLVSAYGCAGSKANTAVTTIEITNDTINNIAATLETACQDGTITADTCAKIQTIYDRIKIADDAVIHATRAAIEAGEDPQSSPDYDAAMAELTKAIGDLYALAGKAGLLKGETNE